MQRNMRCILTTIALAAFFSSWALQPDARAQLSPFDTFFGEFNGVALWTSLGVNADRVPSRRTDVPLFELSPIRYGFELLLGPYPAAPDTPELYKAERTVDSLRARIEFLGYEIEQGLDTAVIAARLAETKKALAATERRVEILQKIADEKLPSLQVDLGIGFEYTDSFRPGSPAYAVKMPVTGMYVSAYVSRDLLSWEEGSAGVYIGGNVGHFQLHDAVAYGNDGASEYEVSASTFALEPILGFYLYYESGRVSPFLELSYKYLAFDAVHYRDIAGGGPAVGAPRRLDLSGVYLTFGLQMAKK